MTLPQTRAESCEETRIAMYNYTLRPTFAVFATWVYPKNRTAKSANMNVRCILDLLTVQMQISTDPFWSSGRPLYFYSSTVRLPLLTASLPAPVTVPHNRHFSGNQALSAEMGPTSLFLSLPLFLHGATASDFTRGRCHQFRNRRDPNYFRLLLPSRPHWVCVTVSKHSNQQQDQKTPLQPSWLAAV